MIPNTGCGNCPECNRMATIEATIAWVYQNLNPSGYPPLGHLIPGRLVWKSHAPFTVRVGLS